MLKNDGGRGRRRQQFYAKQKYAETIIRDVWKVDDELVEPMANRLANHLKSCKCYLCVTPRNSEILKPKEKLTLQERKSNINFNEQLDDDYFE